MLNTDVATATAAPAMRPASRLTALRCAGELAATTGATDATVAYERGGDLAITTSLAGTFPLRTIGIEADAQLASVIAGHPAWLDHLALATLYLPPHAHVLAIGITTESGRGIALLRYDTRPTISVDDVAFLQRALSSSQLEDAIAA
ncbi:MAG: hypothetical protein J7513_17520 [Solirubrobacteraceae bacterium]|nr:hypothetical protein [Solirubrobacteraceae bacterium]